MISGKRGDTSRIRLGVDARLLSASDARGMQRVAKNLVRELAERHASDIDVVLYSNRPFLYTPAGSLARVLPGSDLGYCVRRLPQAVRADGCDVFLGTGAATLVRSCPSAHIVHDVCQRGFGARVPLSLKLSHQYMLSQFGTAIRLCAAKRVDAVIFGSGSARRDVLGVPRGGRDGRHIVIYWGVEVGMTQVPTKAAVKCALSSLHVDHPFLLYVGAVSRRKNIEGLVAMYQHVRRAHGSIRLVVVGDRAWPGYDCDPFDGIEGIAWFRWLPDELLVALYRACEAFVTLSWCEGFGLPVAEAMFQGAPVVVSDGGALAEVAGEAGLLVDPNDPVGAGEAVLGLVCDDEARALQRQKSLARAPMFAWSNAGDRLACLVRDLAGTATPRRGGARV